MPLLIIIIFLVITLPGWAFLAVTRFWKNFSVFQRWLIAISLSIAFYPILFYFTRCVLPGFQLGFRKLGLMLFVFLILILVFLKKEIKKQFIFEKSEWVAIIILLFTLFGRYYLAYLFPYPAWSDSLHHTLLTDLTATSGILPFSLDPYAPIPLNRYHLGLYSITGIIELFSKLPAHLVLQWTMQTLSALCGIGVYLVLDRRVSRKAAITGLLVASLISFQPNWYFNWGRYTQLSSQIILLAAWYITWECFDIVLSPLSRRKIWVFIIASSVLNAGVFLLHFRVAIFYLPLILISLIFSLWKHKASIDSLKKILLSTLAIALLSMLLILPAFLPLMSHYNQSSQPVLLNHPENAKDAYFGFSFHSFLTIGLRLPLLITTILLSIFSFIRDRKWTLTIISWVLVLFSMANIFRLGIPYLNFTNAGAIYIMFYLPASLLIGSGIEFLFVNSSLSINSKNILAVFLIVLACFYYTYQRIQDIEPFRWFISESDLSAMEWINQNSADDDVFGINTYFWLPESPHGTDAGYWIPYFTNRKTSAGVMLNNLGPYDYRREIIFRSLVMELVAEEQNNAFQLCDKNIDYIFIGDNGDFSGNGLDLTELIKNPILNVVFELGKTAILKVNCP